MFITIDQLAFIQVKGSAAGITVLKIDKIDKEYMQVEVMCEDIGSIFVIGELKGYSDAYRDMGGKVDSVSKNLDKIASSLKNLKN